MSRTSIDYDDFCEGCGEYVDDCVCCRVPASAYDTPMDLLRDWVAEWEATWVDPDEESHEWADIYQRAKALLATED